MRARGMKMDARAGAARAGRSRRHLAAAALAVLAAGLAGTLAACGDDLVVGGRIPPPLLRTPTPADTTPDDEP